MKNVKGLSILPDTVDFVLSPSEYYAPVLSAQLSIDYPNEKMLSLGYPCHDVFYRDTKDEVKKLIQKKYNKIILWMPTFRKGGGVGRNDSEKEMPVGIPLIYEKENLEEIQDFLNKNDSLLIIKIHPKQEPETYRELSNYDNIIILDGMLAKKKNIDNYRLLKSVDALISDYSSIVYSFLLLNKPIGFVLEDINEYKLGFSVENPDEYLVGDKIYELEQFLSFIRNVVDDRDGYAVQRESLIKKLYSYNDGNSCQRIIEFMESL